MNIHEYQAKKILSSFGVGIPKGKIAYTPNEAKRVALEVSKTGPWFVKAQIQSGARAQGYLLGEDDDQEGGVRIAETTKDILKESSALLGKTLVTIQTGPKGKLISRVYVEEYAKIKTVFYAGMAIDRVNASISMIFADVVNEEITNLAINAPEKILKIKLDLEKGASDKQVDDVLDFLSLHVDVKPNLENLISSLHKAFTSLDATMIEINPVGITRYKDLLALDAKMSFDDNALYRHKDILRLQDDYEEDDRELVAKKYKFSYSEFDGSVGCIVNGDGTALAAMDMLRDQDIGTACFLNVKGGVDKDKIAAGIKLILTNPKVEVVLINILGGFLRCNLISEGIILAASDVGLNVPLVVRFEGTNKEEAKEILANSKLPIIVAETMEDAVEKVIQALEDND